jgi:predicted methyltransferase
MTTPTNPAPPTLPRRHWLLGALACAAGPLTPARAQDAIDPRLRAALAGPHRSAANRARDGARHPAQTLAFFGVQASSTVLELSPGGGWYTEVLAPWLRDQGRLLAAHYPADSAEAGQRRARANFEAKLAQTPTVYDRVAVVAMPKAGRFTDLPADVGGLDQVLTFRNVHNWLEDGQLDDILRASFAALKPGGVLGVVDHRAAPGTPLAQQIATGYLTEALVQARAESAGFVLAARSEVNANPADSKDHPHGVWSLPPTLRGGEVDRVRFLAIGESDRFTHRYRKPG